jgi:hypothetical protein
VTRTLAVGRLCTALLGAMALSLAFAQVAAADIQGGCKAWAIGSESGSVDLTSASELHLLRGDVLAVRGLAPRAQTKVDLTVHLFGLGIPLPEVGGLRETDDSQTRIAMSTYSRYARVVDISAATDDCTGSLLVSVDDQSPILNAVGGAGAILGLLGLLGVLKAAFGKGRIGGRIGGGLAGFIGGAGVSLLLQQMLWIDPRNTAGLAPPIAGLLLGVLLAGTLRRAPKTPVSPPEPAVESTPDIPAVAAPAEGFAP